MLATLIVEEKTASNNLTYAILCVEVLLASKWDKLHGLI